MRGCLNLSVFILGILVFGCGKKPLSDAEKIRALLPEAASVRDEELTKPGPSDYSNFTNVFFHARRDLPGGPDVEVDLHVEIGQVLLSRRPVSVIADEDITSFVCDVKADEATGTVAFEREGFWRGSVGFRAERRDGKWRIVEFRLTPTKRVMSLGADGLWVLSDHVGPLNPVIVGVEDDGAFSIRDLHFTRRIMSLTREELYAFLKRMAAVAPRGADQLPALRVVIEADGITPYEQVQDAMVQCMRVYISGISWRMHGRVLTADLPKGAVSMEDLRPLAPGATIVPIDVGMPPGLDGEETPIRREFFPPAPPKPPEVRVKICLENSLGEPIYNQKRVYPEGWTGERDPRRSLAGGHVAIHLGTKRLRFPEELATALAKIIARRPDTAVTIDASPTILFMEVFDALDACRKANVKSVNFQAPPAPDSGGGDWLWQ